MTLFLFARVRQSQLNTPLASFPFCPLSSERTALQALPYWCWLTSGGLTPEKHLALLVAKDWRFALVPRHLFDPDSFPSSSSSLSSPSSSSSSSTSSGIASACSNKQQQQQQQQQSKGQQQQLLGDLHLLIAVRRGHSRGTGTWEGIDGEEDDPSHGAQSLGGSSRGTATGFTAHESSFIEAAFDSKICLDGSSKEALDKFCFLLCTSVSKPIGVRNT